MVGLLIIALGTGWFLQTSPLYWAAGGEPLPGRLTGWLALLLTAMVLVLVAGTARFARRDLNR